MTCNDCPKTEEARKVEQAGFIFSLEITYVDVPPYATPGSKVEVSITIQMHVTPPIPYLGEDTRAAVELPDRNKRITADKSKQLADGQTHTWTFDLEMPSDPDKDLTIVPIAQYERVVEWIDDDVGKPRTIENVTGNEKTKRDIKRYGTPLAIGAGTGLGASELVGKRKPEDRAVLAIGGAALTEGLTLAKDDINRTIRGFNLPTWSIWGIAVTTVGLAAILK